MAGRVQRRRAAKRRVQMLFEVRGETVSRFDYAEFDFLAASAEIGRAGARAEAQAGDGDTTAQAKAVVVGEAERGGVEAAGRGAKRDTG